MKSKLTSTALALALAVLNGQTHAESFTPQQLTERAIHRRAVEAVIWGMPAVNYDLMLQEMLTKTPGKVNQVIYWGRPLDWHNQTLTPNPDTLYFMAFFNTKDVGPIVVEVPPGDENGSLNANFCNVWQEPLMDAGLLGVDAGKGMKLLILPPDYQDKAPAGYEPIQPQTHASYALIRSNLKSHGAADVSASLNYAKRLKVYPLSQVVHPPETSFTDVQKVDFDSTIKYDASFYSHLDRIVQSEPWLERDRVMIDTLKYIGIEKGKPFQPGAEVNKLLADAVREAGAELEAEYDAGFPGFFTEKSRWMTPPPDFIRGMKASFKDPDDYPWHQRGLVYTYAFIAIKNLGAAQFYSVSIKDAAGQNFDGAKNYRLHVPPHVPVEQYWSVTAYDRQLHTLIKGMPRASCASNAADLQKNSDGSVDVYFGPTAPVGKESNWMPTDPQRGFELMARFYAPKKEFFEKTWVLPDVEEVK